MQCTIINTLGDNMTHLSRLIAANGNVGGTIHQFDRAFDAKKLMGKSISIMTNQELSELGSKQEDIRKKVVIMAACVGKAYPERVNYAQV